MAWTSSARARRKPRRNSSTDSICAFPGELSEGACQRQPLAGCIEAILPTNPTPVSRARMIETDYIMRMVGVLASFLARLFFLKRAKDFPEALAEIESTERSLLGVDRSLIRSLSASQIMDLFGSDQSLAVPKRYVLGVLLKEEADIFSQKGEGEQAAASALTSLDLLTDAVLKSGNALDPSHEKHILEAVGLLGGRDLPTESQERLFACYEALGRFDKAENALFELQALDGRFYETGLQFYQRLLARSDEDLIRGKLPRPEAEEGAREFKQRFGSTKS